MATVHISDAPPDHLLSIYLEDHLSGATAGRELARRALLSNRGTPYEAGLRQVTQEIEAEMADLRSIIKRHGRGAPLMPMVKVAAAIAGERLGRFKLNGQLRGYSPLSRVLELEGLMMGVQGKRLLWQSLQTLDDPQAVPDEVDLERLAEQADDQLARLLELHERAATAAFATS